ncbi:zinc finger, CCHC-type containing protein [Tanacetum coccineum]
MLQELKTLFAQQAEQELLQTTRDFHSCKQEEGQSVSSYVLKMKGYINNLECLGYPVTLGLAVSLILISLRKEFDGFVQNYNMYSLGKTVNELHDMLKLHEQTLTLPKNNAPALHAIRASKVQKAELLKKKKNAASGAGGSGIFNIELNTFLNRSWIYDTGCGTHICNTTQGLRASRKLKPGALSLYVGNGQREAVEAIGEDTHPSIDTSLNHEDDDLEIDEPQSDIIPIRMSTRTRRPTDRMCLYINAEEHELGDLGEPAIYKEALLDPESDKWLNAMNVEMQSMKDNKVWDLVDLPPNGKTVRSKWIFKKKTDMDGAVHTYKARLVAKGYTQTLRIDYEEIFSLVADIRAIRIL